MTFQVEVPADEVGLVEAARAGEQAAFGVLVERYQEVALRAAYLVVRDAGLAEDVAQEAFVRTYGNLGRFDAGRAPEAGAAFRPWLLRIVRNLALNEVRARGRRRSLWERVTRARTSDDAYEVGPERVLVAGERADLVAWGVGAALAELATTDREVLELRYYLGLSEAEIAAVIGKRPGTVK